MNNINNECPICFEDLKNSEYVILASCLHKYHKSCLDEWFKRVNNKLCPECQTKSSHYIIKNKKVVNPTKESIIASPPQQPTRKSGNLVSNRDDNDDDLVCRCIIS